MIPLTELTLETAPKALWREFLGGYFDGGPHDVGAHPGVFFPRATLAFGQGPVEQPLTAEDRGGGALASAEIRVVCLPRRETVTANSNVLDGLGLLATDYVTFQFQIRAQRPRGPDAQLLADTVAQLLKALLTNPATRYALAFGFAGRSCVRSRWRCQTVQSDVSPCVVLSFHLPVSAAAADSVTRRTVCRLPSTLATLPHCQRRPSLVRLPLALSQRAIALYDWPAVRCATIVYSHSRSGRLGSSGLESNAPCACTSAPATASGGVSLPPQHKARGLSSWWPSANT